MFEKQKEVVCRKAEKGIEWVKDHKFQVGYGAGLLAAIAAGKIFEKVMEVKTVDLGVGCNANPNDDTVLWLEPECYTRFGKRRYTTAAGQLRFDEETAKDLMKAIAESIEDSKRKKANQ